MKTPATATRIKAAKLLPVFPAMLVMTCDGLAGGLDGLEGAGLEDMAVGPEVLVLFPDGYGAGIVDTGMTVTGTTTTGVEDDDIAG